MISMTNSKDNDASVSPGNHPVFGYTLTLLWFYLFIILNLSNVRVVLTLVVMICDMSLVNMLNIIV
jgi:hypothetical protein